MDGNPCVIKDTLEGTARYAGHTFSSCGGVWPPAKAFFALQAKKKLFMLFWLTLGHFWCSVVTSETFSSPLSNFPKNLKKSPKKSPKIPQNPKYQKYQKYQNSKKSKKIPQKFQKIHNNLIFLNVNFFFKKSKNLKKYKKIKKNKSFFFKKSEHFERKKKEKKEEEKNAIFLVC